MRLKLHTPDNAAEIMAVRWNLTLQSLVAETYRARIFKVDSPHGPAALKVYKKVGFGGEGAGIQFLRQLTPGIGAQIYRSNNMRTAVLIEWLDGPTLATLLADGEEARATALLGQVGRSVTMARFRLPMIYRRVLPGLKRDFERRAKAPIDGVPHPDLPRVQALLAHLSRTSTGESVLHGDLGFENVILTPDGPRLLDPKGLRAEPAYDCAKALFLPYDQPSEADFIKRIEARKDILSDAVSIPSERIVQWAAITLAHKVIHGAKKYPKNTALRPYMRTLLDMSGW